jgi:hypothetical protein
MKVKAPDGVRVPSSIEKALEICEALSGSQRGMSVTEIARQLKLPPPTAHRLLGVLKRRGYVRQDEESARYSLTLRMLDLSFRLLGRSELRLHAYPVLREYALRASNRVFIAIPAAGEVTYIWSTGPDEVAMHTVYGKEMPGHCSIYVNAAQTKRRLSCLRLVKAGDVAQSEQILMRFGTPPGPPDSAALPGRAVGGGFQRLLCTCAPVHDYTGREVARVGIFSHGPDESTLTKQDNREAWELARLISVRLGYLAAALPVTA